MHCKKTLMNMEDVEAQIERAFNLINDEPQVALDLLLPLAEAGNSTAQSLVGFIIASSDYRRPPGQDFDAWLDAVSLSQWREWNREDEQQAFQWFVRVAEDGHPESVLQARVLAERYQLGELPWKNATGKRRELLDLAEQNGYSMIRFLSREELNGMEHNEYLKKYMGKP